MSETKEYDYVIVGAGSSGCTVANRLTEDANVTVLLLEAGGWDKDPMIGIPLAWGRNVLGRKHDWMYSTEPEPTMNNRRIPVFRGRVIGGSSSINAMAYVRGHRGDFDRWADMGLPQWSYAHVLPYFQRQESWQGGADSYRGANGPLTTIMSKFPDPVLEALMQAGQQAGHPYTDDYNGAQQEGFCWGQSTIRDGRRCSTAVAYLRPALSRPNLTVEVGAHATSVTLEGTRAVGLAYEVAGVAKTVRAAREVILALGSINTPQLMMLSGLGDPAELRSHGIAVKADLPAVGKNLQDHIAPALNYTRKESGPLHRMLRADRIAIEMAKAHFFGKGMAASLPNTVKAFLKSMPDANIPDTQFLFRATSTGAGPYFAPFKKPYVDGFGVGSVLLRPESRGDIRLTSADPYAQPRIRMNFLSTDRDMKISREGVKVARDVFAQSAMKPFIDREVGLSAAKTDADIDAYVRSTAETVFHPLGTCKMGAMSDESAVVDEELNVRGVTGLRIVDASVMPDLTGGNINSPVIMIAEKAADLIRGRNPPPPATV